MALDDLVYQLSLHSNKITRLTLAFLIQHDNKFSAKVSEVCMSLLIAAEPKMVESVRLYHFATEKIVDAISKYPQMKELVIAGCSFVRGDSLLQLQTDRLQSLNFTYSDQIKGQEILSCL